MGDYYVTTSGAGDGSGDSWANAMDFSEMVTFIENTVVAGDHVFVAGGTYTATHLDADRDGSTTNYIQIIGVKAATTNEPPVGSDWAIGDDRPLFDYSASSATQFDFYGVDYIMLRNLRVSGQHTSNMVLVHSHGFVINCYIENTYSGGRALYVYAYGNVWDCELIGTNKECVLLLNYCQINRCYMHGGTRGVEVAIGTTVSDCIFDTLSDSGVYITSAYGIFVKNCTFYGCGAGIAMGAYYSVAVLNNTFSNCTDGFKSDNSGAIRDSITFDWNNWYNNTRDMSWDNGSSEDNGAKGPHALAIDPEFTDAAGGDFSLAAGSGLIDAGFAMRLGVS